MSRVYKRLTGIDRERVLDIASYGLIVLGIFLSGYVVFKYFEPLQMPALVSEGKSVASSGASAVAPFPTVEKPFRVYEEAILKRDLFQSVRNKLVPDPAVMQKALPALHQRIKLIGILLDEDSKAIVEDLKEKQTHFLSKGETLGSALLEEIKENKVIFRYNNERIEMTP